MKLVETAIELAIITFSVIHEAIKEKLYSDSVMPSSPLTHWIDCVKYTRGGGTPIKYTAGMILGRDSKMGVADSKCNP